jgi:hypothetical protein
MSSRQRCNFAFPPHIKRPKNLHEMSAEHQHKVLTETINSLTDEDLNPNKLLRQYSEKMYQFETVSPKGPFVGFSKFLSFEFHPR